MNASEIAKKKVGHMLKCLAHSTYDRPLRQFSILAAKKPYNGMEMSRAQSDPITDPPIDGS